LPETTFRFEVQRFEHVSVRGRPRAGARRRVANTRRGRTVLVCSRLPRRLRLSLSHSFTHLVTLPSSPSKQSSRTSAILVHARRGTASRQSSPTPPPLPPLPRSPLRQAGQAKVRANFAGSDVTIVSRPRRSSCSPWSTRLEPLPPSIFYSDLSILP
jgi:hypothetical protein